MQPGKLITASFTAIDANNDPILDPTGWKLQVIDRNTRLPVYESSDFVSESNVHVISFTLEHAVNGFAQIVDEDGTVLSRDSNFIVKYQNDVSVEDAYPPEVGLKVDTNKTKVEVASRTRMNDPLKEFYQTRFEESIRALKVIHNSDDWNYDRRMLRFNNDIRFNVLGTDETPTPDLWFQTPFENKVPFCSFLDYVGAPDYLVGLTGLYINEKYDLTQGSIFFDENRAAWWYLFSDLDAAAAEGLTLYDFEGFVVCKDGKRYTSEDTYIVAFGLDDRVYTKASSTDPLLDDTGAPVGGAEETPVLLLQITGIPVRYENIVDGYVDWCYNLKNEFFNFKDLSSEDPNFTELLPKGPFLRYSYCSVIIYGMNYGHLTANVHNEFHFTDESSSMNGYDETSQVPYDGLLYFSADHKGYVITYKRPQTPTSPQSWDEYKGYTADGGYFVDDVRYEPTEPGWVVPSFLKENTVMGVIYEGDINSGFNFINDVFPAIAGNRAYEWKDGEWLVQPDQTGFYGNNLVGCGAPVGVDSENYLYRNDVDLFANGAIATVSNWNGSGYDEPTITAVLLPGETTFVEYSPEDHDALPLFTEESVLVFGIYRIPLKTFEKHHHVKTDGTRIKFGEPGYIAPNYMGAKTIDGLHVSISPEGIPYDAVNTYWKEDGTMFVRSYPISIDYADNNTEPLPDYDEDLLNGDIVETILPEEPNYIQFPHADRVVGVLPDGTYLTAVNATILNNDQYENTYHLFGTPGTALGRRIKVADGKPYAVTLRNKYLLAPRPHVPEEWGEDGTYYPYGREEEGIEFNHDGWKFNPEWGDDIWRLDAKNSDVVTPVPFDALSGFEKRFAGTYSREAGFAEFGVSAAGGFRHRFALVSNSLTWNNEVINRYDEIPLIDREFWTVDVWENVQHKPSGTLVMMGVSQDSNEGEILPDLLVEGGVTYRLPPELNSYIRGSTIFNTDSPNSLKDYFVGIDGVAIEMGQPGYHNENLVSVYVPGMEIDMIGELVPSVSPEGIEYHPYSTWSKDGKKFLLYTGTEAPTFKENGGIEELEYTIFNEGEPGFIPMPANRQPIAYTADLYCVMGTWAADEIDRYYSTYFGEDNTAMNGSWDTKEWAFAYDENGKVLINREETLFGVWDQELTYYPGGEILETDAIKLGEVGWVHPFSKPSNIAIGPDNTIYSRVEDLPSFGDIPYGTPGWQLPNSFLTRNTVTRLIKEDGTEVKGGIDAFEYYTYSQSVFKNYNVLEVKSVQGLKMLVVEAHPYYTEEDFDPAAYDTRDQMGIYSSVIYGDLVPDYVDMTKGVAIKYAKAGWKLTNSIVLLDGTSGFDEDGNRYSDAPIDLSTFEVYANKTTCNTTDAILISYKGKQENTTFFANLWNKGSLKAVTIVEGERVLSDPIGKVIRNKDKQIRKALTTTSSYSSTAPYVDGSMFHYYSRTAIEETLTYVTEEGYDVGIDVTVTVTGVDVAETIVDAAPTRVDYLTNDRPYGYDLTGSVNRYKPRIGTYNELGEPVHILGWILAGKQLTTQLTVKHDDDGYLLPEFAESDDYLIRADRMLYNPRYDYVTYISPNYCSYTTSLSEGKGRLLAPGIVVGRNGNSVKGFIGRAPEQGDYVLEDKDVTTITPIKIHYHDQSKKDKLKFNISVRQGAVGDIGTEFFNIELLNPEVLETNESITVDFYCSYGSGNYTRFFYIRDVIVGNFSSLDDQIKYSLDIGAEDIKFGYNADGILIQTTTVSDGIVTPYIILPESRKPHILRGDFGTLKPKDYAVNSSVALDNIRNIDMGKGFKLITKPEMKGMASQFEYVVFNSEIKADVEFICKGGPQQTYGNDNVKLRYPSITRTDIFNPRSQEVDLDVLVSDTLGNAFVLSPRIVIYSSGFDAGSYLERTNETVFDEDSGVTYQVYRSTAVIKQEYGTHDVQIKTTEGQVILPIEIIDGTEPAKLENLFITSAEHTLGEQVVADLMSETIIKLKLHRFAGKDVEPELVTGDISLKLVFQDTWRETLGHARITKNATLEDPYYEIALRSSKTTGNLVITTDNDLPVKTISRITFTAGTIDPLSKFNVLASDINLTPPGYMGQAYTITLEPKNEDGTPFTLDTTFMADCRSGSRVVNAVVGVRDPETGIITFKGRASRTIGAQNVVIYDGGDINKTPIYTKEVTVAADVLDLTVPYETVIPFGGGPIIADNARRVYYTVVGKSGEAFIGSTSSKIPFVMDDLLQTTGSLTVNYDNSKNIWYSDHKASRVGNLTPEGGSPDIEYVGYDLLPNTTITIKSGKVDSEDRVHVNLAVVNNISDIPITDTIYFYTRKVGETDWNLRNLSHDGKGNYSGTFTVREGEYGEYEVNYAGTRVDSQPEPTKVLVHKNATADIEKSTLTGKFEFAPSTTETFTYGFVSLDNVGGSPNAADLTLKAEHALTRELLQFPCTGSEGDNYTFDVTIENEGSYVFTVVDSIGQLMSKRYDAVVGVIIELSPKDTVYTFTTEPAPTALTMFNGTVTLVNNDGSPWEAGASVVKLQVTYGADEPIVIPTEVTETPNVFSADFRLMKEGNVTINLVVDDQTFITDPGFTFTVAPVVVRTPDASTSVLVVPSEEVLAGAEGFITYTAVDVDGEPCLALPDYNLVIIGRNPEAPITVSLNGIIPSLTGEYQIPVHVEVPITGTMVVKTALDVIGSNVVDVVFNGGEVAPIDLEATIVEYSDAITYDFMKGVATVPVSVTFKNVDGEIIDPQVTDLTIYVNGSEGSWVMTAAENKYTANVPLFGTEGSFTISSTTLTYNSGEKSYTGTYDANNVVEETSTIVVSTNTPETESTLDGTVGIANAEGEPVLDAITGTLSLYDVSSPDVAISSVELTNPEGGYFTFGIEMPDTRGKYFLKAKFGTTENRYVVSITSEELSVEYPLVDTYASQFYVLTNPAEVDQNLSMSLTVVDVNGASVVDIDSEVSVDFTDLKTNTLTKTLQATLLAGDAGMFTLTTDGHPDVARFKTAIHIVTRGVSFTIESKETLFIGSMPKPDPTKSKLVITSDQVAGRAIVAQFTPVSDKGEPASMKGLALELRDDTGKVLETVTEYQQLGKSCNFTIVTSHVGKGSFVVVSSEGKTEHSPVVTANITKVANHETSVVGKLNIGQVVTVVFKPFDHLGALLTSVTDVMMGVMIDGVLSEATSAGLSPAGGFALEYELTTEGPLTFGASSVELNYEASIKEIEVLGALELFSPEGSKLELSSNTARPGNEFVVALFAKGDKGNAFNDISLDAVLVAENKEIEGDVVRTEVVLTKDGDGMFTTKHSIDADGEYDIKMEVTSEDVSGVVGKGVTISIALDAVWMPDGTYYPKGLSRNGHKLFSPGWVVNPEYGDDAVIVTNSAGERTVVSLEDYKNDPTNLRNQYSPEAGFLKSGEPRSSLHPDLLVTSAVVGWSRQGTPLKYSNKSFLNRAIWTTTKDDEDKDVLAYKPAGSGKFYGEGSDEFVPVPEGLVATHNNILYFNVDSDLIDTKLYYKDFRDILCLFRKEGWINIYNYKDTSGKVLPNVNHLGEDYGNNVLWNERGDTMYLPKTDLITIEDDEYVLSNFISIPETSNDFVFRPMNRQAIAYTGETLTVWDVKLVPDSWSESHGRLVKFGEPLSIMPEIWDNDRLVYAFDGEGNPIKGFRNGPKGIWDDKSYYYPSGTLTELDKLDPGSVGWMHPALSNKYVYISDTNRPTRATELLPDYNGKAYGEKGWYLDPTWFSRPDVPRAFHPTTGEILSLDELGSIGYLLTDTWTDRNDYVISGFEGGHFIIDIVDEKDPRYKRPPADMQPEAKDRFGILILDESLIPDYIAPGIEKPIKYGQSGWLPSQRIVMLNGIDGFDGDGAIHNKPLDLNSVKYYTDNPVADTTVPIRIEVTITRQGIDYLEPIWTKGKLMVVNEADDGSRFYTEPTGVVTLNKEQSLFRVLGRNSSKSRAIFHYQSNVPIRETLVYVTEDDQYAIPTLDVEFVGQDLTSTRILAKPHSLDALMSPYEPWVPINTTEKLPVVLTGYGEDKVARYVTGFVVRQGLEYVPVTDRFDGGMRFDLEVTANATPAKNVGHLVDFALPCWDMYAPNSVVNYSVFDPTEIEVDVNLVNDTLVLGQNDNGASVMVRYLSTNRVHSGEIVRRNFTVELATANYGGNTDVTLQQVNDIRLGETHAKLTIHSLPEDGSFVDTTLTGILNTSYGGVAIVPSIAVRKIDDIGEAVKVAQAYDPNQLNFDSDVRGEIVNDRVSYVKLESGTEPLWYFINPHTFERVDVNPHGVGIRADDTRERLLTKHLSTKKKNYFTSELFGVDNVRFNSVNGLSISDFTITSRKAEAFMIPEQVVCTQNPWITYRESDSDATHITMRLRSKEGFAVDDAFDVRLVYVGKNELFSSTNIRLNFTRSSEGWAYYTTPYREFLMRNFGKGDYVLTSGTGWSIPITLEHLDRINEQSELDRTITRVEILAEPQQVLADGIETSTVKAAIYGRRVWNDPNTEFPYLDGSGFGLVITGGNPRKVSIITETTPTSEADPYFTWLVKSESYGQKTFGVRNRRTGSITGSVGINFLYNKPFAISDTSKFTFSQNPYLIDSGRLTINGDVRSIMFPNQVLVGIDDFVLTAKDLEGQEATCEFKFIGDVSKGIYQWEIIPSNPSRFEVTISSIKGEYRSKPGAHILHVHPNFVNQPFSKNSSVLDYPNRRVVPPSAVSTHVTQHFVDIYGIPLLGVWDTTLRVYSSKISNDGKVVEKIRDRHGNNRWMIGLDPIWIQVTSDMLKYDSGRLLATTVKGEWAQPGNFDNDTIKYSYSKAGIRADGNESMIVNVHLRDGNFPEEILAKVVGSELVTSNGNPAFGNIRLINESPGLAQFAVSADEIMYQEVFYKSSVKTATIGNDLIYGKPITYMTPTPNVSEIDISYTEVALSDPKNNPVIITAYLNHATDSQFTELSDVLPCIGLQDIELVSKTASLAPLIHFVGEIGNGIYRWEVTLTKRGIHAFEIKADSVFYNSDLINIRGFESVEPRSNKPVNTLIGIIGGDNNPPHPELGTVNIVTGGDDTAYIYEGTIRGKVWDRQGSRPEFYLDISLEDSNIPTEGLTDDASLWLADEFGNEVITIGTIAPTPKVGVFRLRFFNSKHPVEEKLYVHYKTGKIPTPIIVNWSESPNPFMPYAMLSTIEHVSDTGVEYSNDVLHTEHEYLIVTRNINGELVDHPDFERLNSNELGLGLPNYKRMTRVSEGQYKYVHGTTYGTQSRSISIIGFAGGKTLTTTINVTDKVEDKTLLEQDKFLYDVAFTPAYITPVKTDKLTVKASYANNGQATPVLPKPQITLVTEGQELTLNYVAELSDIDTGTIVYERDGYVPYIAKSGEYELAYENSNFSVPFELDEGQEGEIFTVRYSNIYFDVPDEDFMTRAMVYVTITNLYGNVDIKYRPDINFKLKALNSLIEGTDLTKFDINEMTRFSPVIETNGTFYYALTGKFPVGELSEMQVDMEFLDGLLVDLRDEPNPPVISELRPGGPYPRSRLYGQRFSNVTIPYGKYKVTDEAVEFNVHTSYQFDEKVTNADVATLRQERAETLFTSLTDGVTIEIISRNLTSVGPDWAGGKYSGGETCSIRLLGRPAVGDKAVVLAKTSSKEGTTDGYAGVFIASYEENEIFFQMPEYQDDILLASIAELSGERLGDITTFGVKGDRRIDISAVRGDRDLYDLSIDRFELRERNDYKLEDLRYNTDAKGSFWTVDAKSLGYFKYDVKGLELDLFTSPRYMIVGSTTLEDNMESGLFDPDTLVVNMDTNYSSKTSFSPVTILVKAKLLGLPNMPYVGPMTLAMLELGDLSDPKLGRTLVRTDVTSDGVHMFVVDKVDFDSTQLFVFAENHLGEGSISTVDQTAFVPNEEGEDEEVPFVIYSNDIDDGTFDQDSLVIVASKPEIEADGIDKSVITVTAFNMRDPSKPFDTELPVNLGRKDGMPLVGTVTIVGKKAPGVYVFDVTSQTVGSDEFVFTTPSMRSDKSVTVTYLEPVDPSTIFRCPGVENCTANKLSAMCGGQLPGKDEQLDIVDPGDNESNCSLARAIIGWHRKNGTFKK